MLTVICYYVVYRYFADYSTAEMQQMFLVFILVLMIFIMSRYVNTMQSCPCCMFSLSLCSKIIVYPFHVLIIFIIGDN